MWVFCSAIGPIYIKRLSDGQYGMFYRHNVYETANDPQILADNVYMQVTGCGQWDNHNALFEDVPHDLSEWERL